MGGRAVKEGEVQEGRKLISYIELRKWFLALDSPY